MLGLWVHGERLRRLREQAGFLRAQAAEQAGCSTGHLKNIEIGAPGRSQPSGDLVFSLLRLYGTRLGRTIDIDEVSEPRPNRRVA